MKHRRQFPRATPYTDRHGRRRWRYRVKGFSAELGTDYGSDDFAMRYEAAVKRQKVRGLAGSDRSPPGSLNALIVSWKRSPAFLNLSESTQRVYSRILDGLREKHGTKPIASLQRRHLLMMRDAKSETPHAANRQLQLMKQLLDHAVDLEWRADNPAATVK